MNQQQAYPLHFAAVIDQVHDHDVLNGRGVNIAHHPGNERFRTLVTTRADDNYCSEYSATEKKAVAEEIIKHIKALNPPGRFLRRDGRQCSSRGLAGPWTELTHAQAVKKTVQALRDCNRQDRQGYAAGVAAPQDVIKEAERLDSSGMTRKQAAETVAATIKPDPNSVMSSAHPVPYVTPQAVAAVAAAVASADLSRKRDHEDAFGAAAASLHDADVHQDAKDNDGGRVSPSVENAAEWLKRQRTDEASAVMADLHSYPAPAVPHHHHQPSDDPSVVNAQAIAAAAAAMYAHSDLLPPPSAATSMSKEEEDDDDDDDAVDAAIRYQAAMSQLGDDVHQDEGLSML